MYYSNWLNDLNSLNRHHFNKFFCVLFLYLIIIILPPQFGKSCRLHLNSSFLAKIPY